MSNRAKFWILLGLLLSNVIVGVVGLRALVKLDRGYTSLIESGLPTLNTLRAMTRDYSVVQRASLRAALSSSEQERTDQLARIQQAQANLKQHQAALRQSSFFAADAFRELDAALQRYDAATTHVLAEIRRANPDAARLQREQMRPAYDDLLDELDAMADATMRSGKILSQQYSGESQRFTHLLIALSGWPLAVLGIGLVFAVALAIFLLFAYRAVGTPEQP